MAQMATLEKPENKELVGGKPTKSRKGGWYQCLNNAKIEETRDKLCRLAYKGDIEGLEALLRRESDNQSARALFSILNRPLKYVEDLPVQVKRKQLPSGSSCPANPPDPIQNVGACLLCFQIDLIWLWSEPYLFSQPHLYESKPWYRRMLGAVSAQHDNAFGARIIQMRPPYSRNAAEERPDIGMHASSAAK
ncbi:hypothetical protein HK102_000776 [Quaeritorhiza haematococci]|nr:hypothetical protein HK102_000776 [Quaeritorhiza haematococci]